MKLPVGVIALLLLAACSTQDEQPIPAQPEPARDVRPDTPEINLRGRPEPEASGGIGLDGYSPPGERPVQPVPPETVEPTPPGSSGAEVATRLQARYLDTRASCNTTSQPAFLCSGVLLRALKYPNSSPIWNPNPSAFAVSFSYLRRDAKFREFLWGYSHGFIFTPVLQAGTAYKPEVLCSFPVDGDSWQRPSNGCGAHNSYRAESIACSALGITTAEQFVAYYRQGANPDQWHMRQCVLTVNGRDAASANAFYQGLRAQTLLNSVGHNEVVMSKWPANIPAQLPIEAFFYVPGGDGTGLTGARADQQAYFNATGLRKPVIKVTLPQNLVSQDAAFTFDSADQAVTGL